MALDPSISLGVRPMELANPLAQYSQIAAIQNAQNQNSLAQYQLATAQREQESTNALNKAYAAAYNPTTGEIDANKLRQSMAAGGFGSKLPAVEKGLLELGKLKTDTQKAEGDLVGQRMELSKRRLETVRTPDEYLAWHNANHKDPVLRKYFDSLGVTAESANAEIMKKLSQPGGFEQLLRASALGLEKSMEQHFAEQNLGGTKRTLATPKYAVPGAPLAATVVPGSEAAVTMTPAEAANVGLRAQEVGLRGREVNLREEEAKLKREGIEGISPKELQKRNAALPQAKSSVESFETKTDQFIKDLEKLRDDPGLNQITGPIYGRTPSASREGSRAQSTYNKIFAKGGFQGLQDLREASKTGGALGNVSNEEGRRLEASVVGGLDRTQHIDDVKAGINALIEDLKVSKARVRNTFDDTYSYRAGSQPAAPAAPAKPSNVNLDQERANAKAAIAAGASADAVRARFKQNTGQEL